MKNLDLMLLERLSILDKDVPLYKKIIKLQEEVGELSQEFLAWDDKSLGIRTNSSKSAKGTLETVIEETCDVINVAIDILNAIEMSQEYKDKLPADFIESEFHRKLLKWYSKVQSKEFDNSDLKKESDLIKDDIIVKEMVKIIAEDKELTSKIGYIENMNGNINF